MLESIKKWFQENEQYGLTFWFAYDPVAQKPSITLFMAYIAFWISAISIIALQFRADPILAALTSLLFTALMIVFYMIRSINKAKFDLSNKALELESGEENKDAK